MMDRLPAIASSHSDAERLRLALDAARLGDWSWDAATDIVTLSIRAAEILGVAPGPVMTWTAMRGLLHPDDRESARVSVDNAIATRSDYDVEYQIRTQEGEKKWVAARGHAIYAADGSVLGMLGILQDITEPVDIVDVFRRTEDVLPIADAAIAIGAKCLWQQIGVKNMQADAEARAAGLDSVMDRCVKIEHARLFGGLHWVGVNTGVISARRPA
jgi:PAS domain S-box-containing protein